MINKERLVTLFCDLARIKSPSGQEEEIAQFVSEKLRVLGLTVQRDSYGNMVAKLAGEGEPLILCAHLDTVPIGAGTAIIPIIEDGVIKTDGSTILGADNKNYVAAILEMLSVISENTQSHRSLEIVFTREEEQISRGAANLDVSLLNGKECLIADNAVPLGEITLSAPFYEKFEVVVRGKEAHVKNPEAGIDAIKAAALLISRMPLGRIDDFTTANVAFISGGLVGIVEKTGFDDLSKPPRNSVPNIVKFFGEVRGPKEDSINDTLERIGMICTLVQGETGAEIEFVHKRLATGYIHGEKDSFVQEIASVIIQQGVQPRFNHSIGGSDANVLVNLGIKAVVISSGEKNNHTYDEQMAIKDLMSLTDFLVKLANKS